MVVTFNPAISSRTSFTSNNKTAKAHSGVSVVKPMAQEYKAGSVAKKSFAHSARTIFLGLASLAGIAGLNQSCADPFMEGVDGNKTIITADSTKITPTVPKDTIPTNIATPTSEEVYRQLDYNSGILSEADKDKRYASKSLNDNWDSWKKKIVFDYDKSTADTLVTKQEWTDPTDPSVKTYRVIKYPRINSKDTLGYDEVSYVTDKNYSVIRPGYVPRRHIWDKNSKSIKNWENTHLSSSTSGVTKDSLVVQSAISPTVKGIKITDKEFLVTTGLDNVYAAPPSKSIIKKVTNNATAVKMKAAMRNIR